MNERRNDFDELMRRALEREAARVHPSEDGLLEIRQRIAETPVRSRRPWLMTAAAGLATAAAVAGGFVLVDRPHSQTATSGAASNAKSAEGPGTGTLPVAPPSSGAGKESSETRALPVYWIGDVSGMPASYGPRLYRTFVNLTGDPAAEAVRWMIDGRSGDPDYRTAWTGAAVRSVTRDSGRISVDLSALPSARLAAKPATVAVQQLVYTVEGVYGSTDPVRITLDGAPVRDLFGRVDTRTTLTRAAAIDVQAAVWITAPVDGATASSPVVVSGIANVFEATVSWQVRDAGTGAVVREGTTTATQGQAFTPFSFRVSLPAGRYVVACFESSAEDGRPTLTDTKTLTIR